MNKNILAKWLVKDLSSEEIKTFESSEDFAVYKRISEYSNCLETPAFHESLMWQSIAKRTVNKTKVRRFNYRWMAAAAASVVFLFGLFYFINSGSIKHYADYGKQITVLLPDGSEVRLNSNSKLEYNSKSWHQGFRTLSIEGEAYFKVKKGSLFTVETEKGNVSVLGTQFSVLTHARSLEVSCFSGKVKVQNPSYKVVLNPGQAIRILDNSSEEWTFDPGDQPWTGLESNFFNTPLSVVFTSLENQFKFTILQKEPYLNQRFTGSYSHDDPELAYKTVLEAMNIGYTLLDGNRIILTESQ